MFGRKSTIKYGCNLQKTRVPPCALTNYNSVRDIKSRVIHHEVSWTELCATKNNHPSQKELMSVTCGWNFSPWSSVKVYGCKQQDGVFFTSPDVGAMGVREPHLRMTVITRMFRFGVSLNLPLAALTRRIFFSTTQGIPNWHGYRL